MAYEVRKQIRGRDYLYRVERYREAATGYTRTRWQYLGKIVDGQRLIAPARRRSASSDHRASLVLAAADLLESSDPARVTLAMVAQRAGLAPSTVYRYFPNRKGLFAAALTSLCDRLVDELGPLDGPIGDRLAESKRLNDWLDAMLRELLRQRAIRYSLGNRRRKLRARVENSLRKIDPKRILATYLRRLQDARLAPPNDSQVLARAVLGVLSSVLRATATQLDADDPPMVALRDVYPVIEAAVFGKLL
jgi:AcrR family transcriptional regulator